MANVSSYDRLSDWNEDDDVLFVQQPDAPKKASPAQMKEYILGGLDVSSVGGTGKYISAISEADGKISATEETMDEEPTANSVKPVTSGGIKTAIDDSVSLKTATGNPITLTDAANANAEELLMTIEPVQSGSGDPSPTNVRPISGLTEAMITRLGKNLFSIDSNRIGKDYDDETRVQRFFQTIPLPKGTYTWKFNSTMSGLAEITCGVANAMLPFSDINIHTSRRALTNQSPTNTINITDNFPYAFIGVMKTSGALTLEEIESAKVQLELGSTATDYEAPVTPATASITFGQTVYGGSVNFKTGEVTVTHGMVDAGTLGWFANTAGSNDVFVATMPTNSTESSTNVGLDTGICSNYKSVAMSPPSLTDKCFTLGSKWYGGKNITLKDSSYTDAAAFKTAMSGVQLCYELATPTTLTLTPAELELLKGNNTITANGAEISIEYYPDNAIGALAGRVDALNDKTDTLGDSIDTLVSGKVDRFVSSSNGATQTIDIGTKNVNRMYLLSVGYSTQYGDHYVFGLILINDSSRIKYVSLVDGTITVSATYTNGIVTLTFSESPYSNAALIRLS